MTPQYSLFLCLNGVTSRIAHIKKLSPNFSSSPFFNPCHSSQSLTILVSARFIMISLVFFYLISKLVFSGFLQSKRSFVHDQNNSR